MGLDQAIDAAFLTIASVQNVMSFHDANSELSRLNAEAWKGAVKVSPPMYEVLALAQELHAMSDGIFDVTVGRELVEQHLLPTHHFLEGEDGVSGCTADIELRPNHKVFFSKRLCVDLGGIAKGFAVDQAVDVLKAHGMAQGIVNAGGDLRCFGEKSVPISLRHPSSPARFVELSMTNRAMATSANAYAVCAQVDGRTRAFLKRPYSVSVVAESCMKADAFTKIVFALEEDPVTLLSQYDVSAAVLYPDDTIRFLGKPIV